MLLNLEIRDFAIIDDLGAVLGERVSAALVRSGAKTAYVDAQFHVDDLAKTTAMRELLDEYGIATADGELILSREIQASGRSSARINGRSATAALLGALGQLLVDIHGQSDHLSLL